MQAQKSKKRGRKNRQQRREGKTHHCPQAGGFTATFALISRSEIRRAFELLSDKYPPVLNLKQAAEIAGVATSTLKRHVSEGRYKDCVSRGKPLRFWRDKFIQEAMKDK